MKRKLDATTWMFIGVGGFFVLVGVILGVIAPQGLAQEATRVEQITAISAANLEQQAPGTEVLLEGRISSANPVLSQTFVAYTAEMYRGTDENDYARWEELKRVTPPLQLEMENTRVQIVNQGYILDGDLKTWQESEILSYSSMRNKGTMRERGLEQNAAAMVLGKAQKTSEGMGIEAEMLYGGTQASYIATQRNVAFWLRWAGVAVTGAGLLIVGFVYVLSRGKR